MDSWPTTTFLLHGTHCTGTMDLQLFKIETSAMAEPDRDMTSPLPAEPAAQISTGPAAGPGTAQRRRFARRARARGYSAACAVQAQVRAAPGAARYFALVVG